MLGRPLRRALVALLTPLALGATAQRPTAVDPLSIQVDETVTAEGPRVRVTVRRGATGAAATLEGLTLGPADRARILPFASVLRGDDTWTLRCGDDPTHHATCRIRRDGDALEVVVTDHVPLRTELDAVGLAWRIDLGGAATAVRGPGPLDADGGRRARDGWFRAPLALVARATAVAALAPDLRLAARARRVPQFLDVVPTAAGAVLRHGLAADERGLERTRLRNETLRFAHRLHLATGTDPDAARLAWTAAHWQPGPAGSESTEPLGDRPLAERLAAVAAAVDRGPTRTFAGPGASVALPPESTAAGDLLRLGIGGTLLIDAASRDADDPRVRAARELARAAPDDNGLVPHAFVFAPTTPDGRWSPGDPNGPEPGRLRVADSATHALELLDLEARHGIPDAALARRADALARFLIGEQALDGSFPTLVDARFRLPVAATLPAGADQLRIAAFLAAHGAARDDAAASQAAARALDHVLTRIDGEHRFRPLFQPAGTVATAAIVDATDAAIALAARIPRFAAVARRCAAELAARQIAWDPPGDPEGERGGFAGFDHGPARTAQVTADAGLALARFHATLGGSDALSRAVAALRRALVRVGDVRVIRALQRAEPLLGAGVIDLRDPLRIDREGLDALWFEDVRVAPRELLFRVVTLADFGAPLPIVLRGLDPQNPPRIRVDGAAALPLPHPDGFVVEVAPRRVPTVRFDPPTELPAGEAWSPTIEAVGASGDAAFVLEVATAETADRPDRLTLERRGDRLLTPGPVGLPRAGQVLARVAIERPGARATVPATGWRSIEIGDAIALDCPFAAEATRGLPPPVRFADGRSLAQPLVADRPLTLTLPVPASAERLELVIVARGGVEVRVGGSAVHASIDREPGLPRRIATAVADPRLWTDGQVVLEIAPASGQTRAEVARIEFRAVGDRARAPGLRAAVTPPTLARIRTLVVPVDSAWSDASTVIEHVRLAFFGDGDYRATPPPVVRTTSGSAAELIAAFSGGRTRLTGTVGEPVRAPESDPRLLTPTALLATLDAAAPALLPQLRQGRPDVIVLAVAAPPWEDGAAAPTVTWRPDDGRAIPVVRLATRMSDGSLVASGRIASMLGRVVLGWPAAEANLGALVLDGRGTDPHVPPPPSAPRLIAAGWAGVVDLAPGADDTALRLDPMRIGRSAVRLLAPPGSARGDLWLTVEDGRADAGSEPGGLLIVRRGLGPRPPRFVRRDGSVTRVESFRISPRTAATDAPHLPATHGDLLRRAAELGAATRPSLATLQGELPWRIDDLRADDHGGVTMRVRWTGRDLLRAAPLEWSQTSTGTAPSVRREARGDVFGLPSGSSLQAATTLPADGTATRIFARLELAPGSGSVAFRAAADGTPLGAGTVRPSTSGGSVPIELDAPAGARRLTLAWTATEAPFAATLTALTAVPRAGGAVVLDELLVGSVRLADDSFVGRARRLAADRRPVDVPVLLPAGPSLLALRHGLARDAAPARLTIRLRELDGSAAHTLVDALPIEGEDAVGLLLIELPERAQERAAILELGADGGGAVWILGVQLRAG